MISLAALQAAEPTNDLKPIALNVGFIRSCFLNVNRADAEGAFKVLAETVGRKRGYRVATQTRIYETPAEIESAIRADQVNLAIIDSWKYLMINLGGLIEPYFVTSEQGKVGKKYVLLTRRASGFGSLADLRAKGIVELEVANSNAGKAWLDTLLLEQRLGGQKEFFGEVTLVAKPALAVLPVFFGKKSVCLVDHFAYELMVELNPQVGRELQVISSSEPYVDNILCLSNSGWGSAKAKADFIDILADLHLEPAGQQILTLFKVGPLVPFQEAQLETVRKLRAKYNQWREAPKL